ncbi:MAG: hypothetical protein PHH93_10955 [Prolixibacteraceae bacterium]|nr:hypothetical protein [Prolixibacteraceae bacterium]
MRIRFILLILTFLFIRCKEKNEPELLKPHKGFIENITSGNDSFYSVRKPVKKRLKSSYAIGMFDSGIGGLTVFDAVVNADFFDSDRDRLPDGVKDFQHEQFIYLADQANMPYSNYAEEGNTDLLVEHVLKDALFLYNNRYHKSPESVNISEDNPNIKAVVIACNTATAFGKPHVEELMKTIGTGIKVIGVIDAGCKGALEITAKDENVAIAVFATPATVSSEAYVNTLNNLANDHSGEIRIIQQGGRGLAEAIDNKPDFINGRNTRPGPEYKGPSLFDKQYTIHKDLFPYYNFDTTGYRMLFNKSSLEFSDTIQINSIENYTRYHIVTLAEKLRVDEKPLPLKAIILGCTHYPYASEFISEVINELRQTERYSSVFSDTVHLIDPALNTARELYQHLADERLFNDTKENRLEKSRFYISIPNVFEPSVETADSHRFTYDYQYNKRTINQLIDYTLIVPFSEELISGEQFEIIEKRLPYTYRLINKN